MVIRASGTNAYDKYIQKLGGMASAETIVFQNREMASDPAVVSRIRQASVLFIAGGDQSKYVHYWKGTPVATAIQELAAAGKPIGGTSAGLAILGEFVYSSETTSTTSADALANPYEPSVTLERDFLHFPQMRGMLTDTHFIERDRMGRTLAFLARVAKDGWAARPREVAIDRETAVLVEADGRGSVAGKNAAFFLQVTEAPVVCERGKPLTFRGVKVRRVEPGGVFHLIDWSSSSGTEYTLSVEAGVVLSNRPDHRIY